MSKQLIQGIANFRQGYYREHQAHFEELAQGQSPRVLFITCSDSRVDPNLFTQADVGDIFVVRNAGNIIPPYGAANGGEGAAIEYALNALDIREVIVCGHTHCGAMKGLFKMDVLENSMPIVYGWLQHTEATRRVLTENYASCNKSELMDIAVAENVLTQLDNLRTYPIVRAKLHRNELVLHGWIYSIEGGRVWAYDAARHEFVPPERVSSQPEEYHSLMPGHGLPTHEQLTSTVNGGNHAPSPTRLSQDQRDRIYRGSR